MCKQLRYYLFCCVESPNLPWPLGVLEMSLQNKYRKGQDSKTNLNENSDQTNNRAMRIWVIPPIIIIHEALRIFYNIFYLKIVNSNHSHLHYISNNPFITTPPKQNPLSQILTSNQNPNFQFTNSPYFQFPFKTQHKIHKQHNNKLQKMTDINVLRKQISDKYTTMCQKINHSPNNSLVRYLVNPTAKSFYLDLIFRGNDKLNFNHRLTDRDLILLSSSLDGHQNVIRHIDFSFNQLSDVGVQIFVKVLEGCSSLVSLNLQGNNLTQSSAEKIGTALTNSQTLKYLNFENNNIATNGIISITKTLLFSSKEDKEKPLEQLNIANNGIDIDGVICVTSVLNWNNNSLKVLNLDNPSYQSIGQECAVHFAKMLQVNRGLQKLSLRKNGLTCDAIFTIKNLILENNKLRVLDLSCNKIAFNGCESLAEILTSKYCVLESLILSSNRVGHYGAKALAQALSKNRTLVHLDLTRNDIDDNGLKMIAESLETNQNLVSLKLYWNHFGQLSLREFHKLAKRRENSATFWDFNTYIVDNQIQMALVDNNIKYDIQVSKKYFI